MPSTFKAITKNKPKMYKIITLYYKRTGRAVGKSSRIVFLQKLMPLFIQMNILTENFDVMHLNVAAKLVPTQLILQ